MQIKIFALLTLWTWSVLASNYPCSERSTIRLLKHPTYDFSIKLLQRVARASDFHFVYSPLTTWLQLSALAQGASDKTLREIKGVTRYYRKRCFMKQLRFILYKLDKNLQLSQGKIKSVMMLDSLMGIKKSYVRDLQYLFGIDPVVVNFDESRRAASQVNSAIRNGTDGVIKQIVYYDDFISTVLLTSDASYFKNEWMFPFDSALTKQQPFYSSSDVASGVVGNVSMMNQVGTFNLVYFAKIKATVLELPFANRRICMLVFLPDENVWVDELLYNLQKTRFTPIFTMYSRQPRKLVNVSIPRFEINTEIENLHELVFDMGIRRIFSPKTADFNRISNHKMFVSLMTQISNIEVTEKGVISSTTPHSIGLKGDSIDFNANRPFVYMIIDRITEFILYGGMYSVPSVY